jgi:hypothetical protein
MPELVELGLVPGDVVRWRDRPGGRWRQGTVTGRERDGSVGVRDGKGASRAIVIERLEVRGRGPRGAVAWEPVTDRAARSEQLALWTTSPELGAGRGKSGRRGGGRAHRG